MEKEKLTNEQSFMQQPMMEMRTIKANSISYIDTGIVYQSLKGYPKNRLFQFLTSQFGEAAAMKLMKRYRVGSSKHWDGATVFWQIDRDERVRTG